MMPRQPGQARSAGREVLWRPQGRIECRHLLLPPALAAFWLVLLFPGRDSPENVRLLLLIYGQVLLPPLVGWIAAGLLLGDPCRELLLAAPRPVWCALLERYTLACASALASWAALLLTTILLASGTPAGSLAQLSLGGAATCLAFAGLGLWAGLRLRSALSGGLAVAALWAAGLIFRLALLAHPLGHLVHPFLLLTTADSPLWTANALVLGVVAATLTILALRLTRNEEALLPHGATEEAI